MSWTGGHSSTRGGVLLFAVILLSFSGGDGGSLVRINCQVVVVGVWIVAERWVCVLQCMAARGQRCLFSLQCAYWWSKLRKS